MSYCRWSSADFRCDLYVYDDVSGGVTIHVAGRRHLIPDADLPPLVSLSDDVQAWMDRHQAVMALVKEAPLVDIELPHAGESYHLGYPEAAAKVRELIALGYHCDPTVADELEAEGAEDVCPTCRGSGVQDGRTCPECGIEDRRGLTGEQKR